jgi:hypothetical protein
MEHTLWLPAKQRDKLLLLEYLVGFFEPGRVYNEKEFSECFHAEVRNALNNRYFLSSDVNVRIKWENYSS